MTDSSFHPGELAVKEKTGETLVVMRNGKIIGDRIPNGAFKFVDKQPMVIATSFDAEQNIWTLLLAGKSGFVVAEDPLLISLNTNWLVSVLDDILWRNIAWHRAFGLLFIELSSRRRLKVNGLILTMGHTTNCW